jgi:hypothetical protein
MSTIKIIYMLQNPPRTQRKRTRKSCIMLAKHVSGQKRQRIKTSHYARKSNNSKSQIFRSFLTIQRYFVRNCRVFVIARGHRPALREKRN